MTTHSNSASQNALVTVGIPTFNRPQGLRRTLDCITKQSYRNLEVIVSDNCSTTMETESVVHEFMKRDPRVRHFRQIENIGATRNIQFVLEQATGDYFMWAADDDEWEPGHIQPLVDVLNTHDHVAVAHCQTNYKLLGKGTLLPIFVQGVPLGSLSPRGWTRRLRFAAQENFGELFYGIYRRKTLVGSNPLIDFEHGGLIHAALKAMINGDAYVSHDVLFNKSVTEEAFLWTYLCAKDKCADAMNSTIERMLENRRNLIRNERTRDASLVRSDGLRSAILAFLRKAHAIARLLKGSIDWHWLYFRSAVYTINNTGLPFWRSAFVKYLLARYLARSVVWTFAMKLKWEL